MENTFQSVFDCHPKVDEIFVVDEMPFLEAGHAQSHANVTGKPVRTVKRPKATSVKGPETEEPKPAKEPKAPKGPKAPKEPKAPE